MIYTSYSKKITLISLLGLLLLTGCRFNKPANQGACDVNNQYACTVPLTGSSSLGTNPTTLNIAKSILQALKDKDIQTLSTFIDPSQGVRFSPYSYVNTGSDIVIQADKIKSDYTNTTKVLLRGNYDGSGAPINLSTKDYFDKFVYDKDFLALAKIFENKPISRGNSINNIFSMYPKAYIVEFYISGFDTKYQGMDRESLTLVLKQNNNKRYLIGIIHGQRTI